MTGSISEVSRASIWRLDIRRPRPAMISRSVAGLVRPGMAISDTSLLLSVGGRRCMTGQREEYVVEGGCVHGESGQRGEARVQFVEQIPDLGGAAVGGDAEGQFAGVTAQDAVAQVPRQLAEVGGGAQHQIQPFAGDPLLELG